MATQTKSVGEQIAEYKAKIKELEDKQLEELQAKKADLEKQLEAVNAEINAIFPPYQGGPAAKVKRSPKAAKEGIQVSANRLGELIKEAGGELSIRSRKGSPAYDIASVKKAIEESKGKFAMGGKGPWPTVTLAK